MSESRTIRTLLVVDVVLVVALVVAAIAYVTSPGAPAASPSGASATSGVTPTPAPTTPAKFQLPSGNIACAMTVDGVTCTIDSITYKAPKVEGCSGKTGHVVALDETGARFVCETGPRPTVASADDPTLQYDSSADVGDYTCVSATDGVRCTNGEGIGFRLARASWQLLP